MNNSFEETENNEHMDEKRIIVRSRDIINAIIILSRFADFSDNGDYHSDGRLAKTVLNNLKGYFLK